MQFSRTLWFRILLSSVLLSALIVSVVSIYVVSDAHRRSVQSLENRALQEADLVAHLVQNGEPLTSLAANLQTSAGLRIVVADSSGKVLADSAPGATTTNAFLASGEVSAVQTQGHVTSVEVDSGLQAPAAVALTQIHPNGGIVRVAIPVSVVDTELGGLRRTAIIGGVLVVAIASAFATFLSRVLTRSIDTVTSGARRMAEGDLEHRLRPEPPLEVEQLARAVNEMASRLSELIGRESGERARLESILSTMSDGVLVVDREGIVELANPAARAMLDAPRGFRSGDRLIALNADYALNELAQAAVRGESKSARIQLLASRRALQAFSAPLPVQERDARGRRQAKALVLLNDVTEMQRVELMRREFVSNASHELRTPISAISASVDALKAGALNDPQLATEFLDRISADAARMERMVKELLELSRLQSGQTRLTFSSVDPREAVEDAVDRFRPMADRAGVSVTAITDPQLPRINADVDKLDQVLSNLLTNAIKATPTGGAIEITASSVPRGIEIRVHDTGHGIEPEHLPHIFERFYKADPSRSDEGTGLGLAITRQIVERHGGDIHVESVAGEGATFIVFLPTGFQLEANSRGPTERRSN